eukprot:4383578-Alexandrium_andersonii.AAC.1
MNRPSAREGSPLVAHLRSGVLRCSPIQMRDRAARHVGNAGTEALSGWFGAPERTQARPLGQ